VQVVGHRPARGGTHGESDAWDYTPLDRQHPTQGSGIHATVLHVLGIDHTRLTDVHGHVIQELL
jgi:Protein of unknown function (DUF1501)